MQEAVPQAEGDAMSIEVGGSVVAEEFGIAEDEASAMAVIGVPSYQGEDGSQKCGDPVSVRSPLVFITFIAEPQNCLPESEGDGGYDGGLFGEDREREHDGGEVLVLNAALFGGGLIEVEGETPEGEGCGEDVGVGKGALREPDGVDCREEDGDGGCSGAGEGFCELV